MKNLVSGFLMVFSAMLLAGCDGANSTPVSPVQTVNARVVESQQRQVPQMIQSTGTIHARETAIISAQIMGRIQQVLVREGDEVRAGQSLVILDDASMRASADQAQAGEQAARSQITAAETDAKLAASTLERYRQLEVQKSVSPQEMDEVTRRAEAATARLEAVRAQSDAARAQVAGAHTMLGYTRIVAPFAGVVTARMADPGTMAAPGVSLLQIDQAGVVQLQVTVDESLIAAIRKGMKVQVAGNSADSSTIDGTVAEIMPAADPASHSFLIKIDLPPSNHLRAGMYATASFNNGVRQAIVVPRTAIVNRGSLICGYVLDSQGIAQLRTLTLGAEQADFVEVLSGLSSGEKLVDGPEDRDLAGKRVEVQP
ncbi:efflux RND transporter periplasmic adaptor subunit [Telmatobacter sp. DSM 110680]|uniref:Efflux RND transporter periplasmic adaptor subunit n=1 Tax=Telmatobacter sp. DSM 110680 TaxID=3036704 RepID=A0AAU7DMG1_9BACT